MKQINFNPRLTTVHNACPCYIHTFETGIFVWSSYINKEMSPLKATGFLGDCHYVQQTNATGIGWHIKKENNKYLLESSNSKVFIRGSEKEIGGATKDETIWIAPATFLNNSAGTDTYTISITLETLGDPGSGHKAELWTGVRNGDKKYPEGSAALLTESAFASAVATAMTAAGHTAYGSLGADEFSTNGKKVTITTTTTVTADVVQYFGIKDTSPTPDNSYAKFRIHEITIEPTEYYETIPTTFPQFTSKITPAKNNTRGKIELDNHAEAVKCMWCWGDGKIMNKTLPNRTDLAPGWHYLKGVNVTEGYTYPIKRFFVKHTKNRSAGEQVPPYSKASLVNKYNQLYNNWVGGMKGCASEVMKAHVLDYLYEKFYPKEEPVFGNYVTGSFTVHIVFDGWQPPSVPVPPGAAPPQELNVNASSWLMSTIDLPGTNKYEYLGRGNTATTSNSLYGTVINGIGLYLTSLADSDTSCTVNTLPYPTIANSLITELGSATSMVNPIEGILPTSQIGTPSGGNGSIFNTTTINIFIDEADPIYEGWGTIDGDTNGDGIVNTQDLFNVLENWLQMTEEYEAAQAGGMPWNGGQSGRVESYGRCCTGELDYAYPAITLHNGKLWELKDQSSNGKTEPGSFLGRNDWEPLKIKSFRGKKENIIKRLENKRKKSIFELEDPKAVIYSGSLDSTTKGRAVTSSTIELENLDKLRPEINKSSRIT